MGTLDGKNEVYNLPVITAEDIKALQTPYKDFKLPYKWDRVVNDTTIIFYGFRSTVEEREERDSPRNSEGEPVPGEMLKGMVKYSPPPVDKIGSDGIRSYIHEGFKQISEAFEHEEGKKKIKFFNIDDLSKEDKQYIAANNIKIPDKSDIEISQIKTSGTLTNSSNATYPHSGRGMININEALLNNLDYLKNTVFHEIGHSLGLRHTSVLTMIVGGKEVVCPKLNEAFNNNVYTVMSYGLKNLGEEHKIETFGRVDFLAIGAIYELGDIKPDLQAKLLKNEQQHWGLYEEGLELSKVQLKLTKFYAKLENEITNLTTMDEIFDTQDLKILKKVATKLKGKMFTDSEISLIKEKITPDFDQITLIDNKLEGAVGDRISLGYKSLSGMGVMEILGFDKLAYRGDCKKIERNSFDVYKDISLFYDKPTGITKK